MRFSDVDQQERDIVCVALVDRFETPGLGAEGPSGERAKDQRHRPIGAGGAQAEGLASESRESKLRGWVAHRRPGLAASKGVEPPRR